MAQRKSAPTNRPTRPAGKPGSKPAAKVSTGKPSATKSAATARSASATKSSPATASAAKKAPPRKPGKSIVNQKQTPWGLIATTVAIVVFAAAVVVIVIATRKGSDSASNPYKQPALPAAMKIKGVTYKVEPDHNHVTGIVKYDSSPPRGGNHNQFWASCAAGSNIYNHQLANENAVHMLEHGAVWITYNPATATKADIAKLATYVQGQDRLALTPYAGLKTKISLQAWGYQLFVNSATDPRISQFIVALKYNPKTTPEPNASCSDPYWTAAAAAASTPGHPFNGGA